MVRDPTSPGALRLAQVGAELAVGDMDDPRSPDAAMRGAYGAGAGVAVTAGRQYLHGGVTRSIGKINMLFRRQEEYCTPISRHLPICQQSCFGTASSLHQTPSLAKA
jgi:hypothetical protein